MNTRDTQSATTPEYSDLAGFEALRREAEAQGIPQDGPLSDAALSSIRRRAAGGQEEGDQESAG